VTVSPSWGMETVTDIAFLLRACERA
jgi:hypothetical protein